MLRDIKFCSGYRHLNQRNGTKVYEPIGSMAWETGYWKPVGLENGVMWKMAALSWCYSVTGILGWGRRILGRKASRLEKGNAGVTNEWQILAP